MRKKLYCVWANLIVSGFILLWALVYSSDATATSTPVILSGVDLALCGSDFDKPGVQGSASLISPQSRMQPSSSNPFIYLLGWVAKLFLSNAGIMADFGMYKCMVPVLGSVEQRSMGISVLLGSNYNLTDGRLGFKIAVGGARSRVFAHDPADDRAFSDSFDSLVTRFEIAYEVSRNRNIPAVVAGLKSFSKSGEIISESGGRQAVFKAPEPSILYAGLTYRY